MDEREIITLYDEEGDQTEFEVLGIINVEEKEYAILLPLEDEENEDLAYIFRIDMDENGDDILTEVEDDAEFENVRDAWEAFCDGDFEMYDEEDIEDEEE